MSEKLSSGTKNSKQTNKQTNKQKEPLPGGHEIYNFVRPFLGSHYLILSLFELCPGLGVDKKIFKEIMHFHYITYMATT